MELREWATRVFEADCLEEKLILPPDGVKALSDHKPGTPVRWTRPPRAPGITIAPKNHRKKFPHPDSMNQKDMRIRCLHAFANHELMAVEMMAWALLAFPEADGSFRRGLASILADEQRHFQLYCDRLARMNVTFGDLPVNDHFWLAANDINEPLDWVCMMHLTFEQANLDHAPYFGRLFEQAGDHASADLMKQIFEDEIGHVGFGGHWLRELQSPEEDTFEVYAKHCSSWNPPTRAKGPEFQEQARLDAGLDEAFIRSLRAWQANG